MCDYFGRFYNSDRATLYDRISRVMDANGGLVR